IIWHMYGVHIKRFNKSMWTGKMSEEEMLHEHPLELADIKAGIANKPVEVATIRRRQTIYLPIAILLAAFMLGGIYGFVNAEDTALTTTERQVPTVVAFVPQTPTPAPTQTATLPPTETALPVPTSTAGPEGTEAAPSTTTVASALTWD